MKKINNTSNIILLICTALIIYFLFWPVPIKPVSWESPIDTRTDTIFSLNKKLKDIKIFWNNDGYSGPEDIVIKMVEGRVKKYLAEVSLLDQPFVKDGDIKVGKLLANAGTEVASFVRYEVGEGIEVEETDFAAEVAAQVAGND